MSIREAFADRFGEGEAAKIEAAAEMHANGVNDGNKGSDPFKWAIAICIGYQCTEIDSYRAHHGITADHDEIKAWVYEHADLATHDGDVDYLTAFVGGYDGWYQAGAS